MLSDKQTHKQQMLHPGVSTLFQGKSHDVMILVVVKGIWRLFPAWVSWWMGIKRLFFSSVGWCKTPRWSLWGGGLFVVCCRDSVSQLDLLQGDSFIIHALGTPISDYSNNNNPLYSCKAAPTAHTKVSASCPWFWLLLYPCQREDWFCIIAPRCMQKLTPSIGQARHAGHTWS